MSTFLNTDSLVLIKDGQAITSTVVIAQETENTHEAVIRLVRIYQADLEEFGGVRFEIEPFETVGGPQRREIAMLNEQQATLLLSYMRNNDIVRAFKKRLVKAFWELAAYVTPNLHFLVPKTLPEALRLAADLAEQLENKKKRLQHSRPKPRSTTRYAMR